MNEDTGTSITSGQDPVYTTSLTSTIGRPPRKVYFWVQLSVVVATMGLCVLSRNFKDHFEHSEIKDLSIVTTLMMRVGELLTTPIGFGCAISIVLGLGLLAIKGAIDGLLKLLIWLNVLWLIAFVGFHTMGIWLPLLKARQAAGQ
jgi:uncharacterized membrane protein YhaH (DUF805 family)